MGDERIVKEKDWLGNEKLVVYDGMIKTGEIIGDTRYDNMGMPVETLEKNVLYSNKVDRFDWKSGEQVGDFLPDLSSIADKNSIRVSDMDILKELAGGNTKHDKGHSTESVESDGWPEAFATPEPVRQHEVRTDDIAAEAERETRELMKRFENKRYCWKPYLSAKENQKSFEEFPWAGIAYPRERFELTYKCTRCGETYTKIDFFEHETSKCVNGCTDYSSFGNFLLKVLAKIFTGKELDGVGKLIFSRHYDSVYSERKE